MKKSNSGLLSKTVVFEGGVSDYKSLLKAVEYALEFVRTSNKFFVHNEPEKIARMKFTVSLDGSSKIHVRILESSGSPKLDDDTRG